MIFRELVPSSQQGKTTWKVVYEATVQLTIHQTGAVYTESAIADGVLPDFTEAADAALKSAESDALKRCAIFLGTQFGLSLYQNGSLVDVIGPVWAPDQMGGRDQYIREMQESAQRVQQVAQVAADVGIGQVRRQGGENNAQTVQDPYMAQVAAGLKVDERDGADA